MIPKAFVMDPHTKEYGKDGRGTFPVDCASDFLRGVSPPEDI